MGRERCAAVPCELALRPLSKFRVYQKYRDSKYPIARARLESRSFHGASRVKATEAVHPTGSGMVRVWPNVTPSRYVAISGRSPKISTSKLPFFSSLLRQVLISLSDSLAEGGMRRKRKLGRERVREPDECEIQVM